MKKVFLPLVMLALIVFSCNKEIKDQQEIRDELSAAGDKGNAYGLNRGCASMDVLQRNLQQDPSTAKRMAQIEEHTRAFINAKPGGNGGGNGGGKPGGGTGGGGGTTPTPYVGIVNIPVIVHVVYNTTQQNISDAQIQSQINVLNADFRATNADKSKTPGEFAGLIADSEVQFTLAQVTRKYSTRTTWGTTTDVKYASKGGVDAIDPTRNLNIWVCEIGGGILGYAQFPGGNTATDGLVIGPRYFGNTGYISAPFDKGRTATHEVGHWLNLRHIWGDGGCTVDDYVTDTPVSSGANYGCPAYPTVKCNTADMTMNYMDYTDDACMYMFSLGQKDRMRAIFATGGARESFVL